MSIVSKKPCDESELLDLYRRMLTIRRFEEKVQELAFNGLVEGAAHLCIGQEAVAAGAVSALREEDYIVSTHRGHGHCIAKGQQVDRMLAELLGRETGYCKGKGGSMHLADMDQGVLGANGIVGAGLPISVGVALAIELLRQERVICAFFGDGALNQGTFHEALNLAALWRLPAIYVCENNQYAVSMSVDRSTSIPNPEARAAAYGFPGVGVDGNDVTAVRSAVEAARERAVNGEGPSLIVCTTYRMEGHYIGDPEKYRTREEKEIWKAQDPIAKLASTLQTERGVPEETVGDLGREVETLVEEAERFARGSDALHESRLMEDIYAESEACSEPADRDGPRITYREALNLALVEEMTRDERVIFVGEDVGGHGGAFQVSRGLFEAFGADRVRDTPISEATIVGTAVGAALAGLRPIGELQYLDFITLAMDQIVNQAAKMRYMFGGKATLPLVIRAPGGSGGRGNAAQHSQSLEAWFMHIPGLKVVMPGTPYDAKGLFKAAIRDNNPVIFIEHKAMYNQEGPVPEGDYVVPLGSADLKRQGTDVTLITYSRMVLVSLEAAEALAGEGIDAEVLDLRTLLPLDDEAIFESVRKTGRAIVVEEDCRTCGVGAEVSARIIENCFDYLDAPVMRVAGLDTPIPYCRKLEQAAVPQVADVTAAVRNLLGS